MQDDLCLFCCIPPALLPCVLFHLLPVFFLLLHWTFRLLVHFILQAQLKEFRRNGSAGIIFTNPLYYTCLRCHVLMCNSNLLIHKAEGWANEPGAPLGCLWTGISYSTPENCYHQCGNIGCTSCTADWAITIYVGDICLCIQVVKSRKTWLFAFR